MQCDAMHDPQTCTETTSAAPIQHLISADQVSALCPGWHLINDAIAAGLNYIIHSLRASPDLPKIDAAPDQKNETS